MEEWQKKIDPEQHKKDLENNRTAMKDHQYKKHLQTCEICNKDKDNIFKSTLEDLNKL